MNPLSAERDDAGGTVRGAGSGANGAGRRRDARPGARPSEVRIRVAASGVNPGDVKKREDTVGYGMPYPRIIPHSDGAGTIDRVGAGVPVARVWCYGAQSYRPFGTAAEYAVVPAGQAVPLPDGVPFEQGGCLGIPGITAHRAVQVAGSVAGRTVLVQGGAGSVGLCAVRLARQGGARVIATVRSAEDEGVAARAGAHAVVRTDGVEAEDIVSRIRALAPDEVAHVVEVAFDANVETDVAVLPQGGSVSAYATSRPSPTVPFWLLVCKNIRVFFLGSDDFPPDAKAAAARDLNAALEARWPGFEKVQRFALTQIAAGHEAVEHPTARGRVVVTP
jgi:NADPH2:quinone reductase